jgi:flagellar biosynthesis protein FlhG
MTSPPRATPAIPRPLRVLAIASGKGGVGKTQIAVSLAVDLAAQGRRVLIVDSDIGLANADLLLDVNPSWGLVDVARGLVPIEDAIIPTPLGPSLLPGKSANATELSDEEKLALMASLDSLGDSFDWVVIDTSAGLGDNPLFFASASEEILLITTPEPTALADTYATARALLRRTNRRRLSLVVNMAEDLHEAARVHERLNLLVKRFCAAEIDLAGWVAFDSSVHEAVMERLPIVVERPTSMAGKRLRALSQHLMKTAPAQIAEAEVPSELRFFWQHVYGQASRRVPVEPAAPDVEKFFEGGPLPRPTPPSGAPE